MNTNSTQTTYRDLTLREEVLNVVTHGVGALLSIVALVVLLVAAKKYGDIWHLVSFSIYGGTLVLLYLSSTFYHSFTNEKVKNLFARFDHVSIFLLIAGTYTPILLTTIRDDWGWTLFAIVWGLAIVGSVIRSIYLHRFRKLMIGVYLLMGWMFVLAGKEIYMSLPAISVTFLLAGGIAYSVGVIFYMWRNLPYSHGIWHLFVLTGSILQFFAIYYSLH